MCLARLKNPFFFSRKLYYLFTMCIIYITVDNIFENAFFFLKKKKELINNLRTTVFKYIRSIMFVAGILRVKN